MPTMGLPPQISDFICSQDRAEPKLACLVIPGEGPELCAEREWENSTPPPDLHPTRIPSLTPLPAQTLALPRPSPIPSWGGGSLQWLRLHILPAGPARGTSPQPGGIGEAALWGMQEGVFEPTVHPLLCTDEKTAAPLEQGSVFPGPRKPPLAYGKIYLPLRLTPPPPPASVCSGSPK